MLVIFYKQRNYELHFRPSHLHDGAFSEILERKKLAHDFNPTLKDISRAERLCLSTPVALPIVRLLYIDYLPAYDLYSIRI